MRGKKLVPVVFAALVVAACSSTAATNSPAPASAGASTPVSTPAVTPAPSMTSGVLTVWTMPGSLSDIISANLNNQFIVAHPGWAVNYQVQVWDGIVAKLQTALASDTPPDIMEIGNTDMLTFSSNGALADLTSYRAQLGGGTSATSGDPNQLWLDSLNTSGSYNGKLYGVPFYAGDRVLIYRTDLFKAANIDPASITSKAKLIAAAQALNAANASVKDFSGFYMAGQNWYELIQMIWDESGQIATQAADGTWTGALETANSEKGIQDYVDYFQQTKSTGPKDNDEANPAEWTVFQAGKVGMMVGNGWEMGISVGKTGAVTQASQVGAIAIPSATDGKTVPVFLGGSNIAVAANSPSIPEAVDWLAELAQPKVQQWMIDIGWIPSLKSAAASIGPKNPVLQIQAKEAAAGSGFTPEAKGWANVEANNPIKAMMTKILTGAATVDAAAKEADQKMNAVING